MGDLVPVKTGRFETNAGEFNANWDLSAGGSYVQNATLTLDPGMHVVRLIAHGGFSLNYGRKKVLLDGAIPTPMVYDFKIQHKKSTSTAGFRTIWADSGTTEVSQVAVPDMLPLAGSVEGTADVAVTYSAQVWKADTPRSDGSLLFPSEFQTYTLHFQADRLPLIGSTGHLWASSTFTLSVIAEFNSLFP